MPTTSPTRDTLQFYLNGSLQSLSNFDPTTSVLYYLREQKKLTGTKEGCNEGDCGACTIVVISLATDTNGQPSLRYQALNACIQLLGSLDGKYLLTVEALRNMQNGALHPAQQLMVNNHASQCGFCTPGFVMSLFAMLHTPTAQPEQPRSKQALCDVLAGNLCRCTGYGPIIESAAALDHARTSGLKDQFDESETDILQQLLALATAQKDSELLITHSAKSTVNPSQPSCEETAAQAEMHYYQPTSEDNLAAYLDSNAQATIVSGATDVGLWITKQFRHLPTLVSTTAIASLQRIVDEGDAILLSSEVSYTQAMPWFEHHYPSIAAMMKRIGSVQVRNAGSIGSNIANGSPIGDMPPALIVLGATLLLKHHSGEREIPLEDFFIEYGKQDLQPREFVKAVRIPKPSEHQMVLAEKISKRFDQDITAVLMALSVEIDADQTMHSVKIAFGGMAGTPMRAKVTETLLENQPLTAELFEQAAASLDAQFSPLSDQRASSDYRLLVAQNLLRKAYHQLRHDPQIHALDRLSDELTAPIVAAGERL